jgi:hypothetical protein
MADTPTTGSEWRKAREEGYIVRLPSSGNHARLRPVALDVLIMSGKIPDILTPAAARTLWDSPSVGSIAERAEIDREFIEMINIVVPAAMMEPRIVDNPQAEDEISLADLDFGDKVAIYQLAIQPAEVLRRFRDGQAADLASVSDSDQDGDQTQPVGKDS